MAAEPHGAGVYAARFKNLCAQSYNPSWVPPADKRTVPVPQS